MKNNLFKVFTNEKDIVDTFRKSLPKSTSNNLVFFSSQLNGFVTDPAYMSVHVEDKIVHRSYAVFELIKVYKNNIFQLDKHIDRFYHSLELLNLENNLYSKDDICLIIKRIAAISRKIEPESDFDVRMFYSAGLGNYSLKVDNKLNTFYAVSVKTDNSVRPINGVSETLYDINGLRQSTANAKTTNYLLSSIACSRAIKDNGYLGIYTDENGNILEGVMSNVGFILDDNTFSIPSFEKTLAGTTAIKCLNFIEKELIPNKQVSGVSRLFVKFEDILKGRVKEAMLMSGDHVVPILQLNNHQISTTPGVITKALQEHMKSARLDENSIGMEKIPEFDDLKDIKF